MSLKLMYITNKPEVAQIAQSVGVDRIFVDLEYIGKEERQGGMDTVLSRHTLKDIKRIRKIVTSSDLLVRINPIHGKGSYKGVFHDSSEWEIDEVIKAGADIIMLPYFKSLDEINRFIRLVNGRARTILLLETVKAADSLEDILKIKEIDEIHIGLNDLSLEQGKPFMFQLLADGTVEQLCHTMTEHGMAFGFGGIAAPGKGTLPAEYIIRDHYHYGSKAVILSRSFCNCDTVNNYDQIRDIFETGVAAIRAVEKECSEYTEDDYIRNHEVVKRKVQKVVEQMT